MSYAKSLGREEEKRYAAALAGGSAVTYVDEDGERLKGLSAQSGVLAGEYKTIYDEQVAANQAAAEYAAQQARLETERASARLNEEHGSVNRGLYRQYRKALASLPQELAAMGYTGGASESSRVELEQGYEENVGESERQRIAALSRLRDTENQTILEGQQAAAAANADARRDYLNAIIALREKSFEDERDRAEALAAAGDFSGYEKLGYSAEDIQRLRVAWETKNPELAIGIAARSGLYGAEELAARPAAWVQQYLNALGYGLKVNGSWDAATERAFKAVFGVASGRYSPPARRYYSVAKDEKEQEEKSKRSGSAGSITVRT